MIGAGGRAQVQPGYFGPPRSQLFGCFHPAPSQQGAGVLLCSALGHEYMAGHRTLRQLAIRLAQAGFPALRFDFFATGDSAGDSGEGSVGRWLDDIATASEELRRKQGSPAFFLVGMRLGATLAARAAETGPGAEAAAVVLCDPIVSGRDYVERLLSLQRERFGDTDDNEAFGFALPRSLREEVEQVTLAGSAPPRARRLLMIDTGQAREETKTLAEGWRSIGAAVEYQAIDTPSVWDEPDKAIVAAPLVQHVLGWIRNAER